MDHRESDEVVESSVGGVAPGDMESNASSFFDDEEMGISDPLLRWQTGNTTSQIAVVGANVCPIESLDYEVVENDIYKEDWRSRKKHQIFQYVLLKWTFALLIGLATGLVGFFSNLAVENIAGFKWLLTSNLMLKHRYHEAFALFAGCNASLAAAASALCAYLAPAAAGSGIPEVKAYLNGIDAHPILAPSTLFVKIFGCIFGVSAGFVLGKEGPMVHTGACIASLLGQGGSRKYQLTWTWLRYFKNDRDRRDLITCGAAAGVAAAFRAPLGGVLFAYEEAASWWRSALLWRTFFTTAVVAVVLRTFIYFCRSGNCGLFGKGGLIMRGVPFKILHAVAISLLTSCCSYGLPWLVKCTPCPPDILDQCPTIGRSGNYKNFLCPPNHYNDLASLFLNTNDDAIRNLFSGGTNNEFHISTLIIFFAGVYCLGIVTYGIAVPSGLFIPVILAGASYGRLVGTLLGPISKLDEGLFALLGAASFLGGTMRMTVSVCVILLELTNDLMILPFVMLVLLISKTVGDCFNKGVYDQMVKMKGFPFMEAHAEPYMRNLKAGDVVSGPLMTLAGVEKGKGFTKERVSTGAADVLRRFDPFDFAKAGSGKGVKLEELDIDDAEMEMYVDLLPIVNRSPYTVKETMSLAKAAVLFRELGLRHLCVVPKSPGTSAFDILTVENLRGWMRI
ncbi:Chloride channel protein [Musa troglodytarum]|uniref:Chloride channel protein n=1 Tax=Musa troglodytarum TaxID=320322 RepID=A0A9E7KMP9_9LILI|nr:Chloride channel protein [Musa troglodytarum]